MASWMRISCLVLLVLPGCTFADPAPFDLAGPKLEVKVTRAGKTLPISETPNLSVGDKLSIKADLPSGQSAHYLLVAGFLRGATNPPPEGWFFQSETWNPKDSAGLNITVPEGAQQVLIFLAPETGGDFKTLVGAVRGRPGAFVRASQDLNQATLDRARLRAYLAAIHRISQSDFEHLKIASPLLARSLSIKFDPDCLQKIPELQAPCLMQGQDSLVLNDGHSASIVAQLTSGNPADLIQQLSYTPQAGFGYASPYIASVMDIARIMDSFHTAQYQYIPALATEQGDELSLELNTPPSFHNPKSVIVVALPAVEAAQMPPLRPVDPKGVYCAEKTELVLPVEGAPLVFSSGYAHGMVLRLKGKNGKSTDLPVKADAEKGGFVADTAGVSPSNFGDVLDGSLHGYWGFEAYNGPEFRLENVHPQHWQIADGDQESPIAGQDAQLHIETENAACVDSILLQKATGETAKADWKATGPNQVTVTVPLKKVKPGTLKLLIKQYGSKEPDTIPFQAFAPASHFESFMLHAGDTSGILKGSRLGDVKKLILNGIEFQPGQLSAADAGEELALSAASAKETQGLQAGENATAKITLKDGRILSLDTTVAAPRPAVTLIGMSVQPPAGGASNVQLADQDEVPQGGVLTFSIHAKVPAAFTGNESVEVATAHGAFLTTLTLASGLVLEDSQVALATLDTGKAFAASAAGPLRFRIIEKETAGNWQSLATLVRLPVFRDLKCPEATDQPCKLTGSRLFLVDSVSDDAKFADPVQVPEGFPGYDLKVPRPVAGKLYLKLHDDPSAVNSVVFPEEAVKIPAGTPSGGSPAPVAKAASHQPGSSTTATGQASPVSPAPSTSATPPAGPQGATAPRSPGTEPQPKSNAASANPSPSEPSQQKTPPIAQSAPQGAPATGSGANSTASEPK